MRRVQLSEPVYQKLARATKQLKKGTMSDTVNLLLEFYASHNASEESTSTEFHVLEIKQRRWNPKKNRYEWLVRWSYGRDTWEPRESFISTEPDEEGEGAEKRQDGETLDMQVETLDTQVQGGTVPNRAEKSDATPKDKEVINTFFLEYEEKNPRLERKEDEIVEAESEADEDSEDSANDSQSSTTSNLDSVHSKASDNQQQQSRKRRKKIKAIHIDDDEDFLSVDESDSLDSDDWTIEVIEDARKESRASRAKERRDEAREKEKERESSLVDSVGSPQKKRKYQSNANGGVAINKHSRLIQLIQYKLQLLDDREKLLISRTKGTCNDTNSSQHRDDESDDDAAGRGSNNNNNSGNLTFFSGSASTNNNNSLGHSGNLNNSSSGGKFHATHVDSLEAPTPDTEIEMETDANGMQLESDRPDAMGASSPFPTTVPPVARVESSEIEVIGLFSEPDSTTATILISKFSEKHQRSIPPLASPFTSTAIAPPPHHTTLPTPMTTPNFAATTHTQHGPSFSAIPQKPALPPTATNPTTMTTVPRASTTKPSAQLANKPAQFNNSVIPSTPTTSATLAGMNSSNNLAYSSKNQSTTHNPSLPQQQQQKQQQLHQQLQQHQQQQQLQMHYLQQQIYMQAQQASTLLYSSGASTTTNNHSTSKNANNSSSAYYYYSGYPMYASPMDPYGLQTGSLTKQQMQNSYMYGPQGPNYKRANYGATPIVKVKPPEVLGPVIELFAETEARSSWYQTRRRLNEKDAFLSLMWNYFVFQSDFHCEDIPFESITFSYFTGLLTPLFEQQEIDVTQENVILDSLISSRYIQSIDRVNCVSAIVYYITQSCRDALDAEAELWSLLANPSKAFWLTSQCANIPVSVFKFVAKMRSLVALKKDDIGNKDEFTEMFHFVKSWQFYLLPLRVEDITLKAHVIDCWAKCLEFRPSLLTSWLGAMTKLKPPELILSHYLPTANQEGTVAYFTSLVNLLLTMQSLLIRTHCTLSSNPPPLSTPAKKEPAKKPDHTKSGKMSESGKKEAVPKSAKAKAEAAKRAAEEKERELENAMKSYKLREHLDPTVVQWLLGYVLDCFYLILNRPAHELNEFMEGGVGTKKNPKKASNLMTNTLAAISFLEPAEKSLRDFSRYLENFPRDLPPSLAYLKTNMHALLGVYELTEKIGQGLNSVFRVKAFTTSDIAVKVYTAKNARALRDEAVRETSAMIMCQHPNTAKIVHATIGEHPYLFLQYYKTGSLFDLLHSLTQRTNSVIREELEGKIAKKLHHIAYGIASGMKHIHSKNYIHFDLNSKNILLDEQWTPCITDFGLSECVLSFPASLPHKINTGTPQWMAPELWRRKEKDSKKAKKDESAMEVDGDLSGTGFPISEKVDVYAYGVILWELTHLGQVLWDGKTSNNEIRDAVLAGARPKLSPSVPHNFNVLLSRCWQQVPSHRMSFPAICRTLEKIKLNPKKKLPKINDKSDVAISPNILPADTIRVKVEGESQSAETVVSEQNKNNARVRKVQRTYFIED